MMMVRLMCGYVGNITKCGEYLFGLCVGLGGCCGVFVCRGVCWLWWGFVVWVGGGVCWLGFCGFLFCWENNIFKNIVIPSETINQRSMTKYFLNMYIQLWLRFFFACVWLLLFVSAGFVAAGDLPQVLVWFDPPPAFIVVFDPRKNWTLANETNVQNVAFFLSVSLAFIPGDIGGGTVYIFQAALVKNFLLVLQLPHSVSDFPHSALNSHTSLLAPHSFQHKILVLYPCFTLDNFPNIPTYPYTIIRYTNLTIFHPSLRPSNLT